jgi:hypothetical protein
MGIPGAFKEQKGDRYARIFRDWKRREEVRGSRVQGLVD